MMRPAIAVSILAALCSCIATMAGAHGGEDHGAPPPAAAPPAGARVVESQTEAFEAVFKFKAAPPSEPVPIDLYVTDFATNAPVAGATVKVSIADLKLDVAATPSATVPGLYEMTVTPGRAGTFSAVVAITTPDTSDLLLFDGLVFGPLEAPPVKSTRTRWILIAAGAVAGLGLAFLLGRSSRSTRSSHAAAALLVCLVAARASAHGGEDHGATPHSGGPASVAIVTKEAQLAFGIRTVVAEETVLPGRRSWRGTVLARPNGKAEIIAPQSGRVAAADGALPQVGDTVRKGQPLLVIEGFLSPQEQVASRSDLAEAEARQVAAAGELQVAQKQWERVEALPEIVSQREREEAEARLATARAADEAARRNRDILAASVQGGRSSAARYALAAPIDGTITQASATIGEAVEAGRRFFSIVDTSRLWVRVDVPESDASVLVLQPGAPASVVITGAAGEPVPATFVSVARTIDLATRTLAAFFEAKDPSGRLVEGRLVDVLVETGGTAPGFMIPASAVVNVSGKTVVFVHVHAEEFAPRDVVLGLTSGSDIEIISGLHASDRVVVSGAFQVRAALLSGT